MEQKNKSSLIALSIIIVFLIIWELLTSYGFANPIYVSSPTLIARDIVLIFQEGTVYKHFFTTFQEAFLGIIFGSLTGVLIAIFAFWTGIIGKAIDQLVTMINSIPQLALGPIFVIWFGIGLESKVIMSSIMVFFMVFFSTYGGLKDQNTNLIKAAAVLGANQLQMFYYVIFPNILPWIFTGVKAGIGASLVGAIVGEYLGSSKGLGWMITYSSSMYNLTRVFTSLFLLLVLGGMLYLILDLIENYVLRYRK